MRLPSLADRVRLRAVCHPWRSNCMLQSLPLPFPWLALPDGTFLSIPGGEIHRISVPEGVCCHGSVDNWLFLMHNDGVCSLMNPFSKTTLELPRLAKVWKRELYYLEFRFNPIFYKLVVPSPLDLSPCSLVAAMIMDDGDLGGQTPQPLSSEKAYMVRYYLVECGGRLLMLTRWFRSTARSTSADDFLEYKRTAALQVFEADLHTSPARWRMAHDLGGHALFLGQHNSKSLPAKECSGYHEDCIYFMCDYSRPNCSANPLCDSGVYNMRNGTITPLMPGTAAVPPRHAGQWRPTWFFPPATV
ncbi:unnamed protein product [Alopecurus aequalis]